MQGERRQKMNNTDLWLREKQLERYAQEIKAYCESRDWDCDGCYFSKPPKEDHYYPCCKFSGEHPEQWEVDE
jgi:hypothetical protein